VTLPQCKFVRPDGSVNYDEIRAIAEALAPPVATPAVVPPQPKVRAMSEWKDWQNWARGLAGAAINSAASAVTIVIVDPKDFDPTNGGIGRLLTVMGTAAIVGAALYLKQHPLPKD
jgi:hypothetical protein